MGAIEVSMVTLETRGTDVINVTLANEAASWRDAALTRRHTHTHASHKNTITASIYRETFLTRSMKTTLLQFKMTTPPEHLLMDKLK